MQSSHKANPTHGQKVATDPDSRYDLKLENSDPVTKDSLAPDSLRRGSAFSRGNPTGTSSACGSSGTFVVNPSESGNVRTIHGKEDDILGSRNPRGSTEKAKETSASDGRSQVQEAFNVAPNATRDASAAGRLSEGFRGGGAGGGGGGGGGLSTLEYSDTSFEGQGSRHTAGGSSGGSTEPHVKHVIPNTARSEETVEEGLDWSKIPKDTYPNTDIGGPDGPGRIAEKYMIEQKAKRGQGLGSMGGKVGGGNDNSFGVLNDSEGAPGVENPSRS